MFSCAYASLTHCTVLHTCLCAHKNESTCCADQQMHHGWDSVCVCVLANVSACMLEHMCLWVSAHGLSVCVCPSMRVTIPSPLPGCVSSGTLRLVKAVFLLADYSSINLKRRGGKNIQLGIQNRSLVPPLSLHPSSFPPHPLASG